MEQNQNIIRVRKNKENPYVMIDNRIFLNEKMSWKAKGILGYLLSRPDDWTIMITDLIRQSKDGRDAVYSGIRELIKAGYIVREAIRESGKIVKWEYIVFEEPQVTAEEPDSSSQPEGEYEGEEAADKEKVNAPSEEERAMPSSHVNETQTAEKSTTSGKSGSGETTSGFSRSGKPRSGKPDTTNTDLTNTDLTNVVVEPGPASNFQLDEIKCDRMTGIKPSVVSELQATVREVTGASVDVDFLQKLLAEFPAGTIREKVRLIGEMGASTEIRNVPGLLMASLKKDYQHIPGQAKGRESGEGLVKNTRRRRLKTISNEFGNFEDEEGRRKKREALKSLYLS